MGAAILNFNNNCDNWDTPMYMLVAVFCRQAATIDENCTGSWCN